MEMQFRRGATENDLVQWRCKFTWNSFNLRKELQSMIVKITLPMNTYVCKKVLCRQRLRNEHRFVHITESSKSTNTSHNHTQQDTHGY